MTRYDPQKHHRRSIRLLGYDYARPGAYFVTICTHEREYLFGDIIDGTMVLSDFGQVVHEEWHKTATVRPYVTLDAFVVMPNYVHGVVMITDDCRGTPGMPLWQRNYHEHVIRNEDEWNEIRHLYHRKSSALGMG